LLLLPLPPPEPQGHCPCSAQKGQGGIDGGFKGVIEAVQDFRAALGAQLGIALIEQVGAKTYPDAIEDELGQEDAGQATQQKALTVETTARPAAQQDAEQQIEANGHRGDQHHHGD
jgi:hypothetical protein